MLRYFAQVVAHELRQPLNGALLQVGLLRMTTDSRDEDVDLDEVRATAAEVERALRGLSARLDEYLDFASSGLTEEMLAETCDLDEQLQLTLDELRDDVETSRARILASSLPTVRGSTSFLRHVLKNLLSNAIKYRRDDAPTIVVDAVDEAGSWRIRVRDDGIGMTPEECSNVFEMFRRSSSQSHVEGNGIGLALCRQIVKRHGGTIDVESTPGRGSTFAFTLPKRVPKTAPPTARAGDDEAAAG